jgi:membrane protein
MNMIERLDAYQRRRRWAGLPLAVLYKFIDDQGGYLTALIAYYGFVSVFPLLLLLVTTLGFALHDSPDLQHRVLDSTLAHFPLIPDKIAANVHTVHGSVPALVIALITSLYGGLGVIQATQSALNKIWGVPRGARPNPITARLRSLLMLITGGTAILAAGIFAAMTPTLHIGDTSLQPVTTAATTITAITINAVLFIAAYRILTARPLTIAQVRAGAIIAALTWQALQWAGTFLLGQMLNDTTATYGLFGIVLGLLAWIYLAAFTFIASAEINAVRTDRLWPRSLLAPFTDQIDLTAADRRAYTSYAETERHKDFQNIDVDFSQPEATQTEATQAETTQTEATQAETTQAETTQAEATQAEATQAQATQPQTTQTLP